MPGLLAREHRAGAAEPRHDLVGDQVHLVARRRARARGAGTPDRTSPCRWRPAPAARRSARRSPGVRVRDGARVASAQACACASASRPLGREPASPGSAPGCARPQQRRVGVPEQRHVGDRQRAQRLAVIARARLTNCALAASGRVAPVVEAHLERDLGRRGAVGGVEAWPSAPAVRARTAAPTARPPARA